MSHTLRIASLLAVTVSSIASIAAAPSDPTPPGPKVAVLPTCTAGGDPVLAIEHKSDIATDPQWKLTLLSKGMYTVTGVRGGKPVTATGCAGTPTVSKVAAALAGQKWQVSKLEMTCTLYAPQSTVYTVGTRYAHTERACGGDRLDDASQQALTTAIAFVKTLDALPASPPPSVPAKP